MRWNLMQCTYVVQAGPRDPSSRALHMACQTGRCCVTPGDLGDLFHYLPDVSIERKVFL